MGTLLGGIVPLLSAQQLYLLVYVEARPTHSTMRIAGGEGKTMAGLIAPGKRSYSLDIRCRLLKPE
jgi:hypothetical protein